MKTAFILILLSSGSALASGNPGYSLAPQSQASGGRSASGNYTVDIVFQTGGAADAEDFTMRSGFAGMLTDPSSLSLAPSPASVNEGGTLHLTSQLVMDDGTWDLLPAEDSFWGVFSGPVTFQSPGVFLGNIVHTSTQGEVGATYGIFDAVLPVTVVNTDPDNLPGYASDGLDDAWQVEHFGLFNPNAAPFFDADGDGYNNLFEYHAGLVPVDRLSSFHVRIRPHPSQAGQYQISFGPLVPGRSYTVQRNPNLQDTWLPLTGAPTIDEGSERTVTDTGTGPGRGFYRVDVLKD